MGGYPYAAEATITAGLIRMEAAIGIYVVQVEITTVALGDFVIVEIA